MVTTSERGWVHGHVRRTHAAVLCLATAHSIPVCAWYTLVAVTEYDTWLRGCNKWLLTLINIVRKYRRIWICISCLRSNEPCAVIAGPHGRKHFWIVSLILSYFPRGNLWSDKVTIKFYTVERQGCDAISALSAGLSSAVQCARGADRRHSEANLSVE
jgi:hypothetical protein